MSAESPRSDASNQAFQLADWMETFDSGTAAVKARAPAHTNWLRRAALHCIPKKPQGS
jgi:hypothetical protein